MLVNTDVQLVFIHTNLLDGFENNLQHVEDSLKGWMTHFLKLLEYDNPALHVQDPDQETCLDGVKAAVAENLSLFVELNEEEFGEYLQGFVMAVWSQLVKVSLNPGQVK